MHYPTLFTLMIAITPWHFRNTNDVNELLSLRYPIEDGLSLTDEGGRDLVMERYQKVDYTRD